MSITEIMRNKLNFRTARSADIDQLVALVTSAYRGDSSRVGWTTEADLLDGSRVDHAMVEYNITRADSEIIITEIQGDIVACAHISREIKYGYFGMFAVRPRLQGQGLGDSVLTHAEHCVSTKWGIKKMRMNIISVRTELIAWYQRRCYYDTNKIVPFPSDNPVFGIPKCPNLQFVVLEKNI